VVYLWPLGVFLVATFLAYPAICQKSCRPLFCLNPTPIQLSASISSTGPFGRIRLYSLEQSDNQGGGRFGACVAGVA